MSWIETDLGCDWGVCFGLDKNQMVKTILKLWSWLNMTKISLYYQISNRIFQLVDSTITRKLSSCLNCFIRIFHIMFFPFKLLKRLSQSWTDQFERPRLASTSAGASYFKYELEIASKRWNLIELESKLGRVLWRKSGIELNSVKTAKSSFRSTFQHVYWWIYAGK